MRNRNRSCNIQPEMRRWPRNIYTPRMNGKLSALYYNRCSCANACRHRATRVHICDLLPYIRLCRRSTRPFPRSPGRSRFPSRCGWGRFCRCGYGCRCRWIPIPSRDPAHPVSDRRCKRTPRACRFRRLSSQTRCRWGLLHHDNPDHGYPNLLCRFQMYPRVGSRTRNKPYNTRPRTRRWPQTLDVFHQVVPRMNGGLWIGVLCNECKPSRAHRECLTRNRQVCGLPCILPSSRCNSPFPHSLRRNNLPFLCGFFRYNIYGCGCRCHWIPRCPRCVCSGLLRHIRQSRPYTWREMCNPPPKDRYSSLSLYGCYRARRYGCGSYLRWISSDPSHAPACRTYRTSYRRHFRCRALR